MRRIGKMAMVWMTVLLLATDPASACRWRRWSCCTPCYWTCPSTCVVVSDCSCSTAPACSAPACSTTVAPQASASPPMPQATAPPQATRSAPSPAPSPAPGPSEALPTPAPTPAAQPAAKPGPTQDDSNDLEGLFGDVDADDGSPKADGKGKDLSDSVETAADLENVDEAVMEEAAAEVESVLESDKAADAGKTADESLDDVDFSSTVPNAAGPNAMPADDATDDAARADDDTATDSDAAADDLMPADGDADDAASGEDAAGDMPADDDAAPADDAADEDAQPEPKDSSKVDRPETIPAPPVAASSTPVQQAMRLWTDNTGKFQVRARLVSVADGKARLLKENGHFTTVPFTRLSAADLAFVQRQMPALVGPGAEQKPDGRTTAGL